MNNDKFKKLSIAYFNEYKDRIIETAQHIAKSQEETFDDRMAILQNDYYNYSGTFDNESIESIGCDLSNYLETIRHSEKEIVMCLGINNTGIEILFMDEGTQFSSKIDIEKIVKFIYLKKCDFAIIHNHPFVFKASPSKADLEAAESLLRFTIEASKKRPQINMLDFAVVTKFDYWSMMQQIKKV